MVCHRRVDSWQRFVRTSSERMRQDRVRTEPEHAVRRSDIRCRGALITSAAIGEIFLEIAARSYFCGFSLMRRSTRSFILRFSASSIVSFKSSEALCSSPWSA